MHLADACNKGYINILIRTVDTDVVVLAVAAAANVDIEELWIAFGTAKSFCHIPVHQIAIGNLAQASPLLCQCFTPTPGVIWFHRLAQTTMKT